MSKLENWTAMLVDYSIDCCLHKKDDQKLTFFGLVNDKVASKSALRSGE